MTKYVFTITCCLCSDKFSRDITLPDGWGSRYDGTDDELGFCPKHKIIGEWADSQCAGCVEGWGDCSLFKGFAYSNLSLTDVDFSSIERGICPKRTNGTFVFSAGNVEEIRLDEKSSTAAGMGFATAIREYCDRWHKKPEPK